MRFLVLQHISCEPPAVYEDILRERHTDCMSSEHFGQLAWQFKRMSGSSG
jgi:hypothetical protein